MAKPYSVEYELEVIEELPPRPKGTPQGGGRSVLEEQLDKLRDEEKYHGKWVRIAKYGNSTAATAAKNVLQQRHGRGPAVKGFKFETRRVEDGNFTGLFVKYDPQHVVDGALEAHEAFEGERKRKIAENRKVREAEQKAARDTDDTGPEDEVGSAEDIAS